MGKKGKGIKIAMGVSGTCTVYSVGHVTVNTNIRYGVSKFEFQIPARLCSLLSVVSPSSPSMCGSIPSRMASACLCLVICSTTNYRDKPCPLVTPCPGPLPLTHLVYH